MSKNLSENKNNGREVLEEWKEKKKEEKHPETNPILRKIMRRFRFEDFLRNDITFSQIQGASSLEGESSDEGWSICQKERTNQMRLLNDTPIKSSHRSCSRAASKSKSPIKTNQNMFRSKTKEKQKNNGKGFNGKELKETEMVLEKERGDIPKFNTAEDYQWIQAEGDCQRSRNGEDRQENKKENDGKDCGEVGRGRNEQEMYEMRANFDLGNASEEKAEKIKANESSVIVENPETNSIPHFQSKSHFHSSSEIIEKLKDFYKKTEFLEANTDSLQELSDLLESCDSIKVSHDGTIDAQDSNGMEMMKSPFLWYFFWKLGMFKGFSPNSFFKSAEKHCARSEVSQSFLNSSIFSLYSSSLSFSFSSFPFCGIGLWNS